MNSASKINIYWLLDFFPEGIIIWVQRPCCYSSHMLPEWKAVGGSFADERRHPDRRADKGQILYQPTYKIPLSKEKIKTEKKPDL